MMLFFSFVFCLFESFPPCFEREVPSLFLSFLQESIIPRKEGHPQTFEKQYNIILDFAIKFTESTTQVISRPPHLHGRND